MSVYDDIRDERTRQDAQWGGSAHDDKHDASEWIAYIERQLESADDIAGLWPDMQHTDAAYRERMVKVAALAVAAIESLDRLGASR